MIKLDTTHWLLAQSNVPRRALLPLAGLLGLAKVALLGPILIAALLPTARQPAAPTPHAALVQVPPDPRPVADLQPMSDRPAAQQIVPSTWETTRLSPTPKLRPLPDPYATLFEPAGCQAPPADYGPVRAGPRMLSARTLAMLEHAAALYGGRLDIAGQAILPSQRNPEGGSEPEPDGEYGVVDLAVVTSDGRVLYEEVDPLIRALRAAGFAAWLRDRGELSPKAEAHIHAVAVGDRQLSAEARAQLNGPDGYFFGGLGLDAESPAPDRHGGPVLCRWMREAATADPRAAPSAGIVAGVELGWKDRLAAAAQSFVTEDPASTADLARRLGYLSSGQEDPSNMCGPLSAAILREAGLLPASVGPVANLKSYWLANPASNGRPWSLFPADQYQVHRFSTGIDRFDFAEWPLRPGDFVYTYSGRGSFSHMFVVTEVDTQGRAYTVTNQLQSDGGYLVERVLLYDPADDQVGVLKSRCTECGSWRRRTGLGGFDVLRRRDLDQTSGSELLHTVAPGETLPLIASLYGTPWTALAEFNQIADPLALQVGLRLLVPVGPWPAETSAVP